MNLVTFGIAIAIATALSGGTITAFNWNKIKKAIHGKEFVLLGDRAVGKSSLINFLRTGNILDPDPKNYRQTMAPEEFIIQRKIFAANSGKNKNGYMKVKVNKGLDVSGLASAYPSWKEAFATADIVVYLFRVDYVVQHNKEHLERIEQDAVQIKKWIEEQGRKPSIYFVGTHCDLEKTTVTSKQVGNAIEYQYDNIANDIQLLARALSTVEANTHVIVGSLKDNEGASGIVSQLFKQIALDSK